MLIRIRNKRGDTIVEVLIAIAIVSLTLAGAYTSVNKSTIATRTAQERGEALKWAETQVEQLKASTKTGTTSMPLKFCYKTDLQPDTSGSTCDSGPIPYKALITQSSVGSNNFKVLVTWDALGGSGTNNVELDYAL
jgi:prepilin-type N-terminal cleavage/methylation domain-containing protein